MKTKRNHLILSAVALLVVALTGLFTTTGCDGGTSSDTTKVKLVDPGHMNVSIFLDLSDRITEDQQVERDCAIVTHVAKIMHDSTMTPNPGVQKSCNALRVVMHPQPTDQSVNAPLSNLVFDVQNIKVGEDRRDAAIELEQTFAKNIGLVYQKALESGDGDKWPGSDIYGYFTDGKLKQQCIKEGYRNILVLVTDGEILYSPTKKQDGNNSNFITTQILENPEAELIVGTEGLDNLEVLVLELRPRNQNQLPKMKSMIENWLKGMGVKKYTICETDRPEIIAPAIDQFFK